MTNKPMLSVGRELLERLTENWNGTDARIELRALLDKPAPSPCQTLGCFDNAAEGWRHCEAHKFYMLREPAAQHQGDSMSCNHDWTDDGEYLLVCTACGVQEDHSPGWRDMSTAPRDGTMLRLLVEFEEHSTEDADEAPTIGANNFDNDEVDEWKFSGWCWTHDHFVEGKGSPVGWLPMLDEPKIKPVAEQAAPVAVVMPFAENIISKLRRFEECAGDSQDVDIGRKWFDILSQLGLLNRVQRSPAYWEMTQQGEDVLEVARLNGVKP